MRLFKRKKPPHIHGNGTYSADVVGESHYQESLKRICGNHTTDGHDYDCLATLKAEPSNPFDSEAVAVFIEGEKVGYLPKNAPNHLRDAATPAVTVAAKIVGGWLRDGGDSGLFGVKLDA